MNITVKVPAIAEKIVKGFKLFFQSMRTDFRNVLSFCKLHSPLIALVAGTALSIAGFVTAFIWRKRQGAIPPDTRQEKRRKLIQNIVSIGMFVAGTALQIVSYVISAGRISALAKALATALNAGSVIGMAGMKSQEASENDTEKLNLARDVFSIRVEDLPCYQDWSGYHSYEVFTNIMNGLKRRINLGERISWNDVMRQLYLDQTDWGGEVGWNHPEEMNWIMVDGWGNEVTEHDQLWASLTGNLKDYRIYFVGMHNLSYFDHAKQKYIRPIVEGEV